MEILIVVTAVIVIILCLIGFFFSVLYDVLAAAGHTFMAVIWILDKIIDFGRRCMKFIRSKEQ